MVCHSQKNKCLDKMPLLHLTFLYELKKYLCKREDIYHNYTALSKMGAIKYLILCVSKDLEY